MNYRQFLSELDKTLEKYFSLHISHIYCECGCSLCCEKGDYPISQLELEYLMQGYISLDNETKKIVQQNIKCLEKGGQCPFLINHRCSVYAFRPIICRVHGIAYLCSNNMVKVPYCVNDGKNYADVYEDNTILINPIKENLDTEYLLRDFEFGEIRNLYDWVHQNKL